MGSRAFTNVEIGWLREAALRARPHDLAAARERRRAERIRKRALAAILAQHAGEFPPNARVELGEDGIPCGLEWGEAEPSSESTREAGTGPASS